LNLYCVDIIKRRKEDKRAGVGGASRGERDAYPFAVVLLAEDREKAIAEARARHKTWFDEAEDVEVWGPLDHVAYDPAQRALSTYTQDHIAAELRRKNFGLVK